MGPPPELVESERTDLLDALAGKEGQRIGEVADDGDGHRASEG
jgi:hypothetical protein